MSKLLLALSQALLLVLPPAALAADPKPYKVLHAMSYHSSWEWNIEQFRGFQDALGDLNVEYKVLELDTKRQSEESAILAKAAGVKQVLNHWQPDLLYANDDNAQKYISQSYLNTPLPIVFSGVNQAPEEYGFLDADNVTGVMEQEHFIPTINLLRSIIPEVKRIAVIEDGDPTWQGVMARIKERAQAQGIEVTEWARVKSFNDYQAKIMALQDQVDAIALLGVFNIKDEQGHDIAYEKVLKWTAENSQLPDFSFWSTRVDRGTLCAVTVSGYEQGFLAGTMARKILVEDQSPQSIAMRPSTKGQPMINLKRAQALGLQLDVDLLLNSQVVPNYAWEE